MWVSTYQCKVLKHAKDDHRHLKQDRRQCCSLPSIFQLPKVNAELSSHYGGEFWAMKVNLLRSPKAFVLLKTYIKQQKYMRQLPSLYRFTTTSLEVAALGKAHEIWGVGSGAKTLSYSFQQITGHFLCTVGSQGTCHTRSRLHKCLWPFLFLTLNNLLISKIPCSCPNAFSLWWNLVRCS